MYGAGKGIICSILRRIIGCETRPGKEWLCDGIKISASNHKDWLASMKCDRG